MNTTIRVSTNMMPVSGRIPEDLHRWLSVTSFDGAITMSDKLRVAIATLKRLQNGDTDYSGAINMHRDLCDRARQQIAQIEPQHGHSEVLSILLEHAPALVATLSSAQITDLAEARRLEGVLVQRSFQMVESLLRQAVTQRARAYDPKVISKQAATLIELATIINRQNRHQEEGK